MNDPKKHKTSMLDDNTNKTDDMDMNEDVGRAGGMSQAQTESEDEENMNVTIPAAITDTEPEEVIDETDEKTKTDIP